jgi:hypothetical protein
MNKLEEWIDYMEGEADLNLMAKLGLLLEHSRRDREILQNLMRVRKLIELADPSEAIHEIVEDPEYLERLHARTMATIKKKVKTRGDRRDAHHDSMSEAAEETSSTLD